MFESFRRGLARLIAPGSPAPLEVSRSLDAGGAMVQHGFSDRPTLAGTAIGPGSALSIAALYKAVQIYTNTIGALDFYVAERDDNGGRRPAYDHPAYDLIHSRPNEVSTSMRLRQAWVGHALTYGNGYLEIQWGGRRGQDPINLHLMDPRTTKPEILEDGRVQYRINNQGDVLPSCDVLHLAMTGWDGLRGYSAVTIGSEVLGVAKAQTVYQGGLYGNSAAMAGHWEVPQKLTSKAKADFRDQHNAVHQGPYNAGNSGIVDGGAHWVNTNFSPQDAELILGCRFSVEEIARLMNLPPHMLGVMDGATFATLEEMNIQLYQMSFLPWLIAIEQECNNKLLGPIERRRYFVRFDVATLLRGNSSAVREQEDADLASGVKSINEIRIARGDNPIPHKAADKHWIQANNNLRAIEDMPADGSSPEDVIDPDDATADDPTLKAKVPDPGKPPAAAEEALEATRGVFRDAVGRMMRVECNALRRASSKPRFDEWAIDFYARHSARLSDAITPACRSLGVQSGVTVGPAHLASEWSYGSLEDLRGLWTTTPPDEMPAAIERTCAAWQADRVDSFTSYVAGVQRP